MNNGTTSSANPPALAQHPVWQTALIVLAALFVLSEAVYVVLGSIAKTCLAEDAACGPIATEISRAFFTYYDSASGAKMISHIFSIGLPGFCNLFYLFVAGVEIAYLGMMLATVAASLLIGFLVVWGYLAMTVDRGIAMRLLLAIGFGVGWCAFYNYTEASVYGVDFLPLVWMRYLEIPVGTVCLFIASLVVRRRAG